MKTEILSTTVSGSLDTTELLAGFVFVPRPPVRRDLRWGNYGSESEVSNWAHPDGRTAVRAIEVSWFGPRQVVTSTTLKIWGA